MITLPRGVVPRFRSALRQSLMIGRPRHNWPPVLARVRRGVLTLHSCSGGLAVRLHADAAGPDAELAFGAEAQPPFAGRAAGAVPIEEPGRPRARARWSEGAEALTADIETLKPDAVPPFPE